MGLRKVERFLRGLTFSANVTSQISSTDGILLAVRAEWKPNDVASAAPTVPLSSPYADNVPEVPIGFDVTDSNTYKVLGTVTAGSGSPLIVVPAYGAFTWFNPYSAIIREMAETLSKFNVPARTGVEGPYGAFAGACSVFGQMMINLGISHDLLVQATILEFD